MHRLTWRQVQDRDRRLFAAVDAESLQEALVRVVARIAGSRECVGHAAGRRVERQGARGGQKNPDEGDELTVANGEWRDFFHGKTVRARGSYFVGLEDALRLRRGS